MEELNKSSVEVGHISFDAEEVLAEKETTHNSVSMVPE